MNLIAQLEAEQIAALGADLPDFKAGDTIRVGYKVTEGTRSRVQNYEGVCIARNNGKGIAGSFCVAVCVARNCTISARAVVNPRVSPSRPTTKRLRRKERI
jgi:ribosomal protein L19